MHRVVLDRRPALVEQRPLRRGHARAVLEVLHAEGHAGERPGVLAALDACVDRRGLTAGGLRVEVHEGVELRVALVDGDEALVEHLGGLALTAANRLGNFDDRVH